MHPELTKRRELVVARDSRGERSATAAAAADRWARDAAEVQLAHRPRRLSIQQSLLERACSAELILALLSWRRFAGRLLCSGRDRDR